MTLDPEFRFSQASLQDFADCRRRFQLRHIERLSWPGMESEPALEHERLLRLGGQFHRLIHQHQVGIDAGRIEAAIRDAELLGWWRSYQDHPLPGLPQPARPEYTLNAPLAGFRLTAKYDLLAVDPGGQAVIVDWKTGRKVPPRGWLENRMQTRVYRFVLAEAGAHLNGGEPIDPDQITLIYWFPSEPDNPQIFPYSRSEFAADRADLSAFITRIAGLAPEEFPLTDDESRCRFCTYRSLCGRGEAAGSLEALIEPEGLDLAAFDLDLGQVAEIEF